jgi:penicillin-binding protein 2
MGERLLRGRTGSIVAIQPETGEILCLVTNSPQGPQLELAIAKAYAPGSTFKVAQALTMLSEGIVTTETTVECHDGITDGNIRVGCHHHRSPLNLTDAIAFSCNTWFLMNFASMINDDFMYEDRDQAINTWRDYMRSMGLGGPVGVDIAGEKGGLLANANYLNRRYKEGWDGKSGKRNDE